MSDAAEQPRGRWLIVAALCALAVIAAVVATVWIIGPDKPSRSDDPADAARRTADEVQQRGVDLEERITGTGDQVAAGRFLDQYRRDQGFADCMEQRGHPDESWTFYNAWVDWHPLTAFDAGAGWVTPLGSHRVSEDAVRLAPAQLAAATDLGRRYPDDPPGYLDDRRACRGARAPLPDGVDVDRSGDAPGAADLQRTLASSGSGLMRRLSAEHADEYAGCMADHGYDAITLPFELTARLQSLLPKPTDVPLGDGPSTAQWTTFLEKEKAMLAADEDCREDIYPEAMAQAAPILADFATVHRDEIDVMAVRWKDILTAAEGLGFDPAKAKQTFG